MASVNENADTKKSVSDAHYLETQPTRPNDSFEEIKQRAKEATERESNMSFMEAIKLYPKAVGWSLLLSTTVIMEGYDLLLVTSFFAFSPWVKKYGEQLPDGTYELDASWQTGLYNGAAVGEIIGLFFAGHIAHLYGYKKTMIGALVIITLLIFIPFFAPNVQTLQAGSILMGLPWGVFQTLPTAYAAEVCPVALRAYLTTYVNLCWVMGQLLATGVLTALLERKDEWAYRIPYGLQWMWPVPLIIGIYFAPESPWWLVRRGETEEAQKMIRSLVRPNAGPTLDPADTVAMMIHTDETEKKLDDGTSYKDCFRGTNLRRTEISCIAWACQNLCGSAFMNYSTYFFIQAGLSEGDSFKMGMSQYAMGFFGTVGSWFLMSRVGRRKLYVFGLAGLSSLLFVIGIMGVVPQSTTVQWTAGAMLLVFTFLYDITIGPVGYTIVSEMSSLQLRQKTIVLARNLYNICGIINGVITPYMLNPTAWDWGARTGFFWASICTCCAVWAFFRLPESKGRTYGQLDHLFEERVPARKFRTTVVNLFDDDEQPTVRPSDSSETEEEK